MAGKPARLRAKIDNRAKRHNSLQGNDMKHPHEVRFTHPISDFEANALKAEGKDVPPDWAESTTLATLALRKLNDSLPGTNKEKVLAGLAELEKAAANIRAFLEFRKAL
jgi:hypothetical protein